jgi:hypothetical protein
MISSVELIKDSVVTINVRHWDRGKYYG